METRTAYAIRELARQDSWPTFIAYVESALNGLLASLASIDPELTIDVARRQGSIGALGSIVRVHEEAEAAIAEALQAVEGGTNAG